MKRRKPLTPVKANTKFRHLSEAALRMVAGANVHDPGITMLEYLSREPVSKASVAP